MNPSLKYGFEKLEMLADDIQKAVFVGVMEIQPKNSSSLTIEIVHKKPSGNLVADYCGINSFREWKRRTSCVHNI